MLSGQVPTCLRKICYIRIRVDGLTNLWSSNLSMENDILCQVHLEFGHPFGYGSTSFTQKFGLDGLILVMTKNPQPFVSPYIYYIYIYYICIYVYRNTLLIHDSSGSNAAYCKSPWRKLHSHSFWLERRLWRFDFGCSSSLSSNLFPLNHSGFHAAIRFERPLFYLLVMKPGNG